MRSIYRKIRCFSQVNRLRDILCWRDEHYVDRNLVLRYDRKRITLEENTLTRGLVGKYVDSYEFQDGTLEFRSKDVPMPYSAYDQDQRVSHAAITGNKRLSAVLEHIKQEQDKAPPKKRRAGTQATRYTPTGRRNNGWNSKLAKVAKEKRAASQGSDV
ncbi:hypothetical protein HW561_22715 [Rhodobacteraceae bacterium B1Z28]|uniref:Transposase n=1 Tax=Ruegeria haliotis TaxID=2747601 RepID=A0ABX2PY81_9RHOB|nr:hypothetical protein [Ruegeria haliotis]NVO58595.1 hypothetical protein [Ruegeria haliotis]